MQQNNNGSYRSQKMPQNLYSKRHHAYGPVPMYDVDFVEFDEYGCLCLVGEQKHGNIGKINLRSDQFFNIKNIRKDVPMVCLVYYFMDSQHQLINEWDSQTLVHQVQFLVLAVNDAAERLLGAATATLTERQWVEILYKARGQIMPKGVSHGLCNVWVPVRLPEIEK